MCRKNLQSQKYLHYRSYPMFLQNRMNQMFRMNLQNRMNQLYRKTLQNQMYL
jgi:hypothetical protein